MAPRVGELVHYVSYGTPGGEYRSQCRAATIAEVGAWMQDRDSVSGEVLGADGARFRTVEQRWEDDACALVVQNPTGMFFNTCSHDDGNEHLGSPDCSAPESHGNPFRYCACGWREATLRGGTWHREETCTA
jgi:hypothetical protein